MKIMWFRLAWHSTFRLSIILLIAFPFALSAQINISKKYEQKAEAMITDLLPDQAIQRSRIDGISDGNHIFEQLTSADGPSGFLVFAAAKGRYDYFDYAVLISSDTTVLDIRILQYRSDHGYQIASKRWLKQFKGYNGDRLYQPGNEVDAVSGASISSVSICDDLYRILRRIKGM